MTLYQFIASDFQLPEVNPGRCRFVEMTLQEHRKLGFALNGEFPIKNPSDDITIVRGYDDSVQGKLQVEYCPRPPYYLKDYTNKTHIYEIVIDHDPKYIEQLCLYLEERNPLKSSIEIWSVWIGDDPTKIVSKRLKIDHLTISDLEMIRNVNICLILE